MDGLFEIVFILIFAVAAVLDSISRKKKKRDRMEEMEKNDPPDAEVGWEEPEEAVQTMGSAPRDSQKGGEPARETADSMVADDFWAILTGQPRQSGAEEGPSAGMSESEGAPDSLSDRARSIRSGEGRGASDEGRGQAGEGRKVPRTRRPGTAASASDSLDRSSLDAWDEQGRRSDPDPPEEALIPMPSPLDRYSGGADDEDAIARQEAELYSEMDEPWSDMADISHGQIGDGTGGADEIADGEGRSGGTGARGGRTSARRRRGRSARYTRLLESGSTEDLRKAVVLREVLDTPLGLREGVQGGRGWRDD